MQSIKSSTGNAEISKRHAPLLWPQICPDCPDRQHSMQGPSVFHACMEFSAVYVYTVCDMRAMHGGVGQTPHQPTHAPARSPHAIYTYVYVHGRNAAAQSSHADRYLYVCEYIRPCMHSLLRLLADLLHCNTMSNEGCCQLRVSVCACVPHHHTCLEVCK